MLLHCYIRFIRISCHSNNYRKYTTIMNVNQQNSNKDNSLLTEIKGNSK